jgi:hypothetical protein
MSSQPVQRDLSVLRAQAETSWRRHNPRLVKQLEKSGKLDQVLNGVAEQAAIILEQANSPAKLVGLQNGYQSFRVA